MDRGIKLLERELTRIEMALAHNKNNHGIEPDAEDLNALAELKFCIDGLNDVMHLWKDPHTEDDVDNNADDLPF